MSVQSEYLRSAQFIEWICVGKTYGAIITRAPEIGSEPTLSTESGTCPSQLSSWRVRVRVLSEYQEPA